MLKIGSLVAESEVSKILLWPTTTELHEMRQVTPTQDIRLDLLKCLVLCLGSQFQDYRRG